MIHVLATWPHFVDHLRPVWEALPAPARGAFVAVGHAEAHAQRLGIKPTRSMPTAGVVLVASPADYKAAVAAGRPVAYLNHGVGQAWRDDHGRLIPSGCGEPKPGVVLFLTPGPHATATTLEANPGARVVEVGSPKVEALRRIPRPADPLLVVSSHWDHKVVPESQTASREYLPALKDVCFPVAVHGHPRRASWMRRTAEGLGLEFIASFEEVCERATIYATDSSSTLFEFAALDRPVIVLNSPVYRRHHSHGLRFWEAAEVGVNVDSPPELPAAVHVAAADSPERQEARRAALTLAYHPLDGCAAQRAAQALLEVA